MSRRTKVLLCCCEWLGFTVFIGSLPYLLHSAWQMATGTAWSTIFAKGDLLVVASILCASGMGRMLVPFKARRPAGKALAALGCCAIMVAAGIALWGLATLNVRIGATTVLATYTGGVIASTVAVLLTVM